VREMELENLTVTAFMDRLADNTPTPGGGSAAALAGGLSATLCAMVARLTVGKTKYRAAWEEMEAVIPKADTLKNRLLALMNADALAYDQVMAAFKLPKETEAQKINRREAIEKATQQATQVPLDTLKTVAALMDLTQSVVQRGNTNCITDAGTALQLLNTAAQSAAYNVRINIAGLIDGDFTTRCRTETDRLMAHVRSAVENLAKQVNEKLTAA